MVSETEGPESSLSAKLREVLPHLDERQRRVVLGAEARAYGRGGINVVAKAAGVGVVTVSRGVRELASGGGPLGRVRKPGGGRKRLAHHDADLKAALLGLVEPDERGDPMSPLRWTVKSTRQLAAELVRNGHRVSASTVRDLLREEGFSLQANVKTLEGKQHVDRDAQFRYLNEQAREHLAAGDPVISVDAKKAELVGAFKNAGREWRPGGEPVVVSTHDFLDKETGKALPYGIYDLGANTGWINVGTDHNTAEFAVESIRRWWRSVGSATYPNASRLMVSADAGGSNGYRTRAWRVGMARLAEETGLAITICHLPPGTSKWNKIEHRMFSFISMNWRARPLTSHEVILKSIQAVTTRGGLRIQAELDDGLYPTGVKITDAELAAISVDHHSFHGEWNYTLLPPSLAPQLSIPEDQTSAQPNVPELLGMTPADLDALIATLADLRQTRLQSRPPRPNGHAQRSGRPLVFPFPDRVVAALLHLRLRLPLGTLAVLYATSPHTTKRALDQIKTLLKESGHTVQPVLRYTQLPVRMPNYVPHTHG